MSAAVNPAVNAGAWFASPHVLSALAAVPVVWGLLWFADRRAARRVLRLAGPRVDTLGADLDRNRRALRRVLTTAALGLALLAAAAPAWGIDARRVQRRGVDLLVCLDVSRSMLAEDVRPSRLGRAQAELRALAERVDGGRLGLVAFAGEARLAVPLTRDMESFADLVDEVGPLSVERGGTDLGAALEAALEALGGAPGEAGAHAALLLVTDGEDLEQRGLRVAERCAERGITVHCAGFGSAVGSKIAAEVDGTRAFVRDRAGQEVISVMNAGELGRIAEATGGLFLDASAGVRPLVEVYAAALDGLSARAFDATEAGGRRQRFQWPLLAAFALWVLEFALTDRRAR